MVCIGACLVCSLLAQSGTASASDPNGLFAIRGAGLLTCKTYVEEREARSNAYAMIGGWLDGYITAINELSAQTFDIAPYESTELLSILINRHCLKNPTDIVYAVTNHLLARLHDDRLKSSSAFVDIRVGTDQVRLYTDTVTRIRAALAAKGFLEIDASGRWDLATQNALAGYQKSVGMKDTGFPDQATLWSLLR